MNFLLRAQQQILVFVIETGQRAHDIARVRAHAELIHPANVDGNLHRKILLARVNRRILRAGVEERPSLPPRTFEDHTDLFHSPAGKAPEPRHGAAQGCQPAGTLPLDERFEGFAKQGRFLGHSGKLLGDAQNDSSLRLEWLAWFNGYCCPLLFPAAAKAITGRSSPSTKMTQPS